AGDKYLVATRLAFGLDTLEQVISPEDSVAPCWPLVGDGAGLDRAILHRDAAPQNFLDQLATVGAWKGFCGRNHQFQTDLAELISLCPVDSGKPVEGNGVSCKVVWLELEKSFSGRCQRLSSHIVCGIPVVAQK